MASYGATPPSNTPYGSGDPFYQHSSGFVGTQNKKQGTSKWIKFGIPLAILIIAGAIVGGVLGSHSSKKQNSVRGNSNPAAASSSLASVKNDIGRFATATNTYGLPVYPTSVR